MISPDPELSWRAGDPISQRAAEFYQQRRFWDWTDADQAALDAWLAESPLHRAAYLRVEGIVAHAARVVGGDAQSRGKGSIFAGRTILRVALPLLIAASVGAFVVWGLPLVEALMQPPLRVFSTDVGGHTMLSFADRTQIELNTDTVIRFRMSNKERTVWLDKGEAWFHVSHNRANPFTLFVGKDRVTDLGTDFLVRRGRDRLEVALIEGSAALAAQGTPTATLTAGEDAVATPVSLSITRRSPQELADELAWRRGMLVFRKTRLSDVVREFNRYNATRLVIADPAIADTRITAELRTDDYETFLQIAQATLNLHVDREGNEILISRRRQADNGRALKTHSGRLVTDTVRQ